MSDNKMTFEVEKNLLDDDWKAQMDVECEHKPIKKSSEINAAVKFISPDMSGVKMWGKLSLIHGRGFDEQSKNSTESWDVEKTMNFAYEDEYHLGCKVKTDTKELTEGLGQLVWTPKGKEDTAYWLRGDYKDKSVGLGVAMPMSFDKYNWNHSFEVMYKDSITDGFYGQPVYLRTGGVWQVND